MNSAYIYSKPKDITFEVDGIEMCLDGDFVSMDSGSLRIPIDKIEEYRVVLRDLLEIYNMDKNTTHE